ncbi:protein cramped isoform X2 [Harmonia axyridis]|uniref:protein cramped isoform X2 n=1 Tax=Harmonia axyridis TaxID=115357 RepID=UPI001E277C5E|nr:protein cramped isoform X2 [Harmonia axyridis]
MNNETKKEETNLDVIHRINTDILLQNIPVDELLGSVTTYSEGNDKNQALRSSARVFKKIKLDANLLNTASTSEKSGTEKKEEQKPDQTPQKDQRKFNINWVTEEVTTLFFEALNEYGKDFENIHSSITQKLKKRGVSYQFTRDHVRHLYYRTWHKISKYLKFPDGVKKNIQELYGLINYGELRKKTITTKKIYFKLNELIHVGCVALRVKGKMVRVRTPMCPALRRINKLDDKDDDLKLPPRVVVQLQPRDMQAFHKVQSFALNPRIKAVLPLQKKLSTFINCVAKRWKAAEIEYLKNNYTMEEISTGENDEEDFDIDAKLITSQLKFAPPKNVKLNLPRTDVCDFITKDNISLKAYEERMGIDGSKLIEKKDCKKSTQKNRVESSSETITKLPIKLEVKDEDQLLLDQNGIENIPMCTTSPSTGHTQVHQITIKEELFPQKEKYTTGIEEGNNFLMSEENNLNLQATPNTPKSVKFKKEIENIEVPSTESSRTKVDKLQVALNSDEILDNNKNNKNISVEEQLPKLAEIRNGWTVEDCDNLTIGELYLMFGSASNLVLEYHWVKKVVPNIERDSTELEIQPSVVLYNNFGFSDTLRKLVDIMQMQQKKVASKCSCGHVCSPKNGVPKKNHTKVSEAEEKTGVDENVPETEVPQSLVVKNNEEQKQKVPQFEDFVKPQCIPPSDQLKAQLDRIEKLKPKYRKGRIQRTKQFVVERELPLMPKASSGHQIVRMNIISHNHNNSTNQPSVNVEEKKVEAATITIEKDDKFEKVVYMEENCNQHLGEMEMKEVAANDDQVASACRANNLEVFLDTTRSLSPSTLLKENENQWISSEVADFSLSSFLGHLESPMKTQDDVSNDMDFQLRSLLTENSFDYTAKFADLAKKVVGDTAN